MKNAILFLDHTSILGGAELSLLDVFRHLDKNLFEPILICPEEGDLTEEAQKLGVNVFIIPFRDFNKYNCIPYIKTIGQICRLIKKEQVNLIHTNTITSILYGGFAGWLCRKPYGCHIRDLIFPNHILYKFLASRASKLICISKAVQNINFTSIFSNSTVIYNGIDIQGIQVKSKKDQHVIIQKYLTVEDSPILVTVGRLCVEKDYFTLLKAVSLVKKEYPSIKLIIVGGAIFPIEEEYQQKIYVEVKRLKIQENIVFVGQQDNVAPFLGIADIFVITSQKEAFGKAPVEAMACRKPVVSTNVGGLAEVVKDGETGLLAEKGDYIKIAENIIKLLKNPQLATEMGEKGFQRAQRYFDIRNTVKNIENIYKEILGL